MLRGTIDFNTIHSKLLDPRTVPDLEDIARSWRFYTLPTHSPSGFGDDRSVCMHVNSVGGNYMDINYDDHWGIGQDLSALVNDSDTDNGFVDSKSVTLDSPSAANASQCHRFIFQHFEELKYDHTARIGVVQDSGTIAAPYLSSPPRTPNGGDTFIKEALLSTCDSCALHYTPYKAMRMDLLDRLLAPSATHDATSANHIADTSPRQMSKDEDVDTATSHGLRKDATHRTTHIFQLHMESLWGKIVLVDDEHRGCFVKNRSSHQFECIVHDAFALIPDDDRPLLLTHGKCFRVR